MLVLKENMSGVFCIHTRCPAGSTKHIAPAASCMGCRVLVLVLEVLEVLRRQYHGKFCLP